MSPELLILCLGALLCVPLIWIFPRYCAQDIVALITFFILAALSLHSALWLLLSSVLVYFALRFLPASDFFQIFTAGLILLLAFIFFLTREQSAWQMIGVAYFTLRNIHVLLDGWMGRTDGPSNLRDMLHYQFFLPLIAVGPIHRYPQFQRALKTRAFDRLEIACGAERALLGLATASLLGGYLMVRANIIMLNYFSSIPPFFAELWQSAFYWVGLYFTFSGLSSFAIGISAMMGIGIEENFNRPYAATNLLDFWTRWHMSLSSWCRDYVFKPITIMTHQPVLGLVAAMLVIGLWHATSLYYLLWSFWQVLGIILSRRWIALIERYGIKIPYLVVATLGPLFVLLWLSLARPLLTRLL